LIERVVDLLKIDAGGYIERRLLSHFYLEVGRR